MDSKEIKELVNGVEHDIYTLLEMYRKYTRISYEMRKEHTENTYDDALLNDIRMSLFFLQNDLEKWKFYYKLEK